MSEVIRIKDAEHAELVKLRAAEYEAADKNELIELDEHARSIRIIFGQTANWKVYGKVMVEWDDLPEANRQNWRAVAENVRQVSHTLPVILPPPATGTLWTHRRLGGTYVVEGTVTLKTGTLLYDGDRLVLYSKGDEKFVRSINEFVDGRFTEATAKDLEVAFNQLDDHAFDAVVLEGLRDEVFEAAMALRHATNMTECSSAFDRLNETTKAYEAAEVAAKGGVK